MFAHLRASFALLLLLTLLCGVAYPWAVAGVASLLFPDSASGSLIAERGRIVGSSLIGQSFVSQKYFHGRPSAAGSGYDSLASGASNLPAGAPELAESAKARLEQVKAVNNVEESAVVPVDMLTSSASGLDPHMSVAAANLQAERVAVARGLSPQKVKALIAETVEPRLLGFIGQNRVNVLQLNLALDRQNGPTP